MVTPTALNHLYRSRDGVQIQMSDTDMTEMIRRLVEGKTDNDANTHETKIAPSNRKVLRPPGLKTGAEKKAPGRFGYWFQCWIR